MTILDKLARSSKRFADERKKNLSLEELIKLTPKEKPISFYDQLSKNGISFICEIKKASPSKGIIDPNFEPLKIVKDYSKAGADAISCLTEQTKFLGSLDILEAVTKETGLPVLRKDFLLDPYQIYEAKRYGASAVLLIAAILDEDNLKNLYNLSKDLGLDALVEVHDQREIERAVNIGADIIGINNRDLKDFSVDLNKTFELIDMIPNSVIKVSESGIKTSDDIKALSEIGVDAVLIGEALMKNQDKGKALISLKNEN